MVTHWWLELLFVVLGITLIVLTRDFVISRKFKKRMEHFGVDELARRRFEHELESGGRQNLHEGKIIVTDNWIAHNTKSILLNTVALFPLQAIERIHNETEMGTNATMVGGTSMYSTDQTHMVEIVFRDGVKYHAHCRTATGAAEIEQAIARRIGNNERFDER